MTDGLSSPEFDPVDFRPLPFRRAAGARLSPGRTGPDGPEYFLRIPAGPLLALGERERFLWETLDGRHSFAQIEREFRERFGGAIARDAFLEFVAGLIEAGAVERMAEEDQHQPTSAPGVKRVQLGDLAAGADASVPRSSTAANPRRRRQGGEAMNRMAAQGGGMRAALREVWSRRLGNPERLFAALARVFWPIRYVSWLLVPLLLMAVLISIKHSSQYYADWRALVVSIPQWPAFWLAEHITTWSARIVEGIVIHGFGGRVKNAHIKLFLGIWIRIQLDETSVGSMSRRQRLWITASPLLWRLAVFSISMIVWAVCRPTRPVVAEMALFLAFMGLLTFFVTSCPFIPLYGYKFLATLLGQENLYGRAFKFLLLKLRGRAVPETLMPAERWGLLFMAVGTALISTIYVGHVLYSANVWTVNTLDGLGGWLALGILVFCGLYVFSLWRFSRRLRAMQRAARTGQPASETPTARVGP